MAAATKRRLMPLAKSVPMDPAPRQIGLKLPPGQALTLTFWANAVVADVKNAMLTKEGAKSFLM